MADSPCASIKYTVFGPSLNPFGTCSNQGLCLYDNNTDTSLCQCYPGWTGKSDWVNTDGVDCQINMAVINGMWIFSIVMNFVFVALTVNPMKKQYMRYLSVKTSREISGKTHPITNERPLLAGIIHIAVTLPAVVMLGILRMTNSDERVASSPATTAFFILQNFGFYCSAICYQKMLVTNLLKSSSNKKKPPVWLHRINDYGSVIMTALSICASFTALIPIAIPNSQTAQQTAFITYCAILLVSMSGWTVMFKYTETKIRLVLSRSRSVLSKQDALKGKEKLWQFESICLVSGVLNVAIYLAFLFIPSMWNKHDYFLPFATSIYGFMLYQGALAVVQVNSTKTKLENQLSFRIFKGAADGTSVATRIVTTINLQEDNNVNYL